MKQKAILYTRVSTDEQNDGYSPADQKERLIKYCDQQGIEIVAFFHDDESGKSFDRPEWLNIITFIKKNKGTVDLLLFIKWDRFSRNVAEAYIAIRDLRKYGIEPQAIEQPLNFEIPESKIMLAVYLAAPEVDNDRRALNIFHGIRRGKKEGRWLGGCPRGYKNARDANNKPIIVPEGGKQEQLVKEAFTLFAGGLHPIEFLRRKMNKEGLTCSRQAFWLLLRNQIYIGKVFVPTYKDEIGVWVEGQHEGIIEESVFYKVQDVLHGRKRNVPAKNSKVRGELPLRGHLICPQCERTLTGSASTGRHGNKFFYYHCSNGCKERQRASEVNNELLNLLHTYKAKPEVSELYSNILKQSLKEDNQLVKSDLQTITKDIEKQKQRLQNARALMLDGEVTPDDYRGMKNDIESLLNDLRKKEIVLKGGNKNYDKEIDYCTKLLKEIDKIYQNATPERKQLIIGSIFPERLVFENNKYRTPVINEVILRICTDNGLFKGKKKGKYIFNDVLSKGVASTGIEPVSKV
jgi:site-specific DNA recombinase